MTRVLVIEDDPHFGDTLKMKLEMDEGVKVDVYRDFETFAEKVTSPHQVKEYSCALVDYQFGRYNAYHKGSAIYLREDLQFKGKIYLWTLEKLEDVKGKEDYDAILPKKFYSFSALERFDS
ncbi:MAG: response regulator transcription factor [Oligoflexales bacterium]|nr:response regulator transcription factor [Oligoflexales bacterium]